MIHHWPAETGYNLKITTTGADQIIEGPNPDRVAIVLPSTTFNYNYALGMAATATGPLVGSFVNGFVLTREAIGDLINQELHALAAAGKSLNLLIGVSPWLVAQRRRDPNARAEQWHTSRGTVVSVVVSAADVIAQGPDNNRTRVIIPSTGLGLSWAIGQPADANGAQIGSQNDGLILTREAIGDLITQELHLIGQAAGSTRVFIGTGYKERY